MAVDIIARGMAQNTKKQLTDMINNLDVLKRKIVDELPTTDISTQIIYMIPAGKPNVQNVYDEWFYVDGNWERIGSTEVNLENYVTFDNVKSGKNIKITKDGNKNLTIDNIQDIIMNFPSYVVTDGTMTELIASLDENNTPTGIIYFGGITCSDLPDNMMQAELKIEVVKNSDNLNVYYFTIVSTNVSPYLWTGTGYQGDFSGWEARPTAQNLENTKTEIIGIVNTKQDILTFDDTPIKNSNNPVKSSGIFVALGTKVDVDGNKVLSEEDFTTILKTKLDGIEENANNYVLPEDVVHDTDYATRTVPGIVTAQKEYGIALGGEKSHLLTLQKAENDTITARTDKYHSIVPNNLNFAVKAALTDSNKIEMTATEQNTARDVINAASADNLGKLDKDFKDHVLDYDQTISSINNSTTGILAQAKKYTDDNKYDDTSIKKDIKANTDAIAVLNGTGDGSVSKTVSNAVAGIVANAPEAYDTLKEIADWIGDNPDGASAMNSAIKANTAAINTKQDKLTFDTTPVKDSDNPIQSGGIYTALESKVGFTDLASDTTTGVVKVAGGGIGIDTNGKLYVSAADETAIDKRENLYTPIVPNKLDYAVRSVRPVTATVLPELAEINTIYTLADEANIAIKLPKIAKIGDFIEVNFLVNDTIPTFTITGEDNTVKISNYDIELEVNTIHTIYCDYGILSKTAEGWRIADYEYTYTEV